MAYDPPYLDPKLNPHLCVDERGRVTGFNFSGFMDSVRTPAESSLQNKASANKKLLHDLVRACEMPASAQTSPPRTLADLLERTCLAIDVIAVVDAHADTGAELDLALFKKVLHTYCYDTDTLKQLRVSTFYGFHRLKDQDARRAQSYLRAYEYVSDCLYAAA